MLRSIKKWAAKRREARRQYRPGIWIERDVKLFNCKLSPGIRVGYASYANDSMIRSGVTIGRYCSIGRRCTLGAATHPLNWVSTHPIVFNGIPPEILPTEIGNDVWLGDNVIIMPGLSIGDGAVIGAGCVVTKSVPPYAVIAGVPGRVLRNRFPDDLAARFQRVRWWDYEPSILAGIDPSEPARAIAILEERVAASIRLPEHHRLTV